MNYKSHPFGVPNVLACPACQKVDVFEDELFIPKRPSATGST